MIWYIKKPKDSTKKTVRTKKKVKSEKFQSPKSLYNKLFLCSNNKLAEREMKKALKIIKFLGTNLTKEVEDMYI